MARKSQRPSVPKGYVGGEKNYKLTVEQNFYRPAKTIRMPAAPKRVPPMPVKVTNVVKVRGGKRGK